MTITPMNDLNTRAAASRRNTCTRAAAALAACALSLLAGCASTTGPTTERGPESAASPQGDASIAEGLRETFAGVDPQRRAKLDALAQPIATTDPQPEREPAEPTRVSRADQPRRPRLDAPPPPTEPESAPTAIANDASAADASVPSSTFTSPAQAAAEAPTTAPAFTPAAEGSAAASTGEQREALIAQLARTLAAPGDSASPAPDADLRLALSLAMVSSIATQTGTPDTASAAELSRVRARLSPQQLAALDAVESLTRSMLTTGGATPGTASATNTTLDARAIAQLLDEAARRSAALKSLSIPSAVLCTRVDGFGRFTPFRTTTFLAARPVRAILYTEVDRFSVTELSSSSPAAGEPPPNADPEARYLVHLGQQWSLYHADGTLAWHSPEQVAREAGRTPPRDWFLTQRIELPATLSIGSYSLKVTVRDIAAGTQAQRTIPITIVADPKLTNAGSSPSTAPAR